ncbi:MAG: PepSY domain-containing protein [Cyclobacteriaceae bacterium]|nr:PepSY domain-containing protein [Cyclobacteriaceae bacterium HetDA_MAG_MS6]
MLFFVVCLSGTFATISHELDWLFNQAMRVAPSDVYASKNSIVGSIREQYPEGIIQFWNDPPEPYLCDIIYVMEGTQRKYVFANPHTGQIQGDATLTIQRFFRDLHYYLFIPFQIGHFTVLLFAFLLFISIGTALFFYKNWYRKLFEIKTGKGTVVLFRSLHRLVGVWSIPFVILFSLTGIWYFLERTNTASISEIANTKSPTIDGIAEDGKAFAQIRREIDYDRAVDIAELVLPGLQVKDILPPANEKAPIYLNGVTDVPLVRDRANRVYLHPVTYEVLQMQNAKQLSPITWLNDIADPLHFGYFGGLFTKLVWFLGGLGISFLVATGIWISLKRKIKNLKKVNSRKMGVWKSINGFFLLLMFGFMYHSLFSRYAINAFQFMVITLGWLLLYLTINYVFNTMIKKSSAK